MMILSMKFIFYISCLLFVFTLAEEQELLDRLSKSTAAIKSTIKNLRDRWDVDNYPLFLASAAMTNSAWELLKVKLQQKILQSFVDSRKTAFVISFMGSSVTAGHGT